MQAMLSKAFAVRAQHRGHALVVSALAAAVVALGPWSMASAAPAAGIYPVVLTDTSCQDARSAEADQDTSCNPDVPSWIQAADSTQVQQVVVAHNVDAPDSVASAAQSQDAPVFQTP
jgi:hypothetical protein